MEIPTEWYVHILPGIVILASFVLLMRPKNEFSLHSFLNSNLLGSAVLIGILGYLIGFIANIIGLEILKPMLIKLDLLKPPQSPSIEDWAVLYNTGRSDLVKTFQDSYQGMVLYRSLFGSFLFLSLVSLVGLFWHKNRKAMRSIILIISLLSTYALYQHWFTYRSEHYKFINKGFSLSSEDRNSQSKNHEMIK